MGYCQLNGIWAPGMRLKVQCGGKVMFSLKTMRKSIYFFGIERGADRSVGMGGDKKRILHLLMLTFEGKVVPCSQ